MAGVADDASIETSQGEIAVHHAERTVLHLLQQVVLAVGLMDFRHASVLVDGCHIEFGMEFLVGKSEDIRLAGL